MDSLIAHDIHSVPRTEDVVLLDNVSFRDMFFSESVFKSLTDHGFHKPSPIQFKAIPLARCGFDLIVQSKSGTGKTLVFVTTTLENIDTSINRVQAIVLTPTREIALQVTEVFKAVGTHVKDLRVESFIGGTPLPKDITSAQNCHVAVGAPGRIRQLIELSHLKTDAVRLFILDEADQLMAKSFQKEINFIYWSLSEYKQVLALSATYPEELVKFLSNYMRSGKLVTPETDTVPVLKGLKQFVSLTRNHPDSLARLTDKENRLVSLLSTVKFNQCLIFSNYKSRAESTCNMLRCRGWSCDWISGGQAQEQRNKALTDLRMGRCRVLVTTDLTARGIDSKGINLVINVDTPHDPRVYLHRMGRAGRFGSHGVVITILSRGNDLNNFLQMLGLIDKNLPVKIIPTNTDCDLWSDESDDFEELFGIESTPESLERYKSQFACTELNKPTGPSRTTKAKKSKNRTEGNSVNTNTPPPDLNEANFPSIPVKRVSLNDYFKDENVIPGEFPSFASLKQSLNDFEVNHKNIDKCSDVIQIKNDKDNSIISKTERFAEENKKYDEKEYEQMQSHLEHHNKIYNSLMNSFATENSITSDNDKTKNVLKNVTNQPVRRFSYSDIAKGKRVECKPVDLKPEEISNLKKSPLKLFPSEKVSNQIEGISISDKAIDGFSKRMYSSVLKGNKEKTSTNDRRNSSEKSSFQEQKNCRQIHQGKSRLKTVLNFKTDTDETKTSINTNNKLDVTKEPSQISSQSFESINTTENSEMQDFNDIKKNYSTECISKMGESTAVIVENLQPVVDNALTQATNTKQENVVNVRDPNNSRNEKRGNINNEGENKTVTLNIGKKLSKAVLLDDPFNVGQAVSSPIDAANPVNKSFLNNENSFYERQVADLSRISRRRSLKNRQLEVTFEDSTTTDSSDSEGEYIINGSFASNCSFARLKRSNQPKSEIKQFGFTEWFQLYNQQASLIHNYVEYTKQFQPRNFK